MSITIAPIEDAMLHHGSKTPIGSALRTKGLSQLPLELRLTGQFSAGVESVQVLQRIQDGIKDVLAQARDANGALVNRTKFIEGLQKLGIKEGLKPKDPKKVGGLQDITSERRLDLIYSMQTGLAYGHANWKRGMDPAILEAVPAQRLTRVRRAKKPRNWSVRWAQAGGKVAWAGAIKTDHVALKTSPIWEALSRFGYPYPPFDFNSGMWVKDVLRPEAVRLGLIDQKAEVKPNDKGFADKLEASVKDVSTELKQALKGVFGDQVEVDGDKVRWKGDPKAYERAPRNNPVPERVFRRSEDALSQLRPADDAAQVASEVTRDVQTAQSVEISAVADGRKPIFHEGLGNYTNESVEAVAKALQPELPQGVVARAQDGHLFVYHQGLVSRLATATEDVWPQVVQHSDDGVWLGYGIHWTPTVTKPWAWVLISSPDGRDVAGFRAPLDVAELYATARAMDWTKATGVKHEATVVVPRHAKGGA